LREAKAADRRATARGSHAAIALVSCAVLVFQIAATRVLSVVHWYHWAFLCVSLAMLGLGAPGVWFSFARRPERFLPGLLVASALLLPASIVAIVKLGDRVPGLGIVFSMVCLLLPMLSLGGVVCLLLLQARGAAIGRMYGFDLVGAALGAVAVIPLLHLVPSPWLLGALGLLPLAAWVCLYGRPSAPVWGLLAAVLALLAWGEPFALRYSKTYAEAGRATPIHEIWTPTARLTFFDSVFWMRDRGAGFNWGRGSRARRSAARQYWIEQDGSAGTPIIGFRGDLAGVEFLLDDVTSVGYQLRPPRSVAIVGAGGGRDILTARVAGASAIDAIELNPRIIEALSTRFREFSGDVYHQPGVTAIAGEGRSALTRSERRYDLIQISLIDSWAATAAGAFALAENSLYTVEAFRLYLDRLGEHGMVSTSRWSAGFSTAETPRLVLLALEALRQEGASDPASHLAVVQAGMLATVLVSRAPFTPDEIARLGEIAARRGFVVHQPPGADTPADSSVTAVLADGGAAFRAQGYRIDPPTDDRPFFFQAVSPFARLDEASAFARGGVNSVAIYALQLLMLVMGALTLALFFLPFVLGGRWRQASGDWRGSLFFACIGVSFMLVEIPCVQRFVLYLGHPSYATTVVLASLLLGAAAGSMASARFALPRLQRLGLLLPLAIAALNLALSPLFVRTLGWPILGRGALAVALLAPVAFGMGMFFPLGMVRFGDRRKAWYWAMNGAAGVLASVLSVALSMELGFTRVLWIAAALYVVAWLLLRGRPAAGAGAQA
jgi:hypothetical protein